MFLFVLSYLSDASESGRGVPVIEEETPHLEGSVAERQREKLTSSLDYVPHAGSLGHASGPFCSAPAMP